MAVAVAARRQPAAAPDSGGDSLAATRWQQQRGGTAVAAAAGLRLRSQQLSDGAAAAAWCYLQQRVSVDSTREMTTTTTTIMTMTIALPVTIKSMEAAVLEPHLAHCGFKAVVVISALSCAVRQHADVRAFVLGRGWRDDSTNGVVVGDSGARGDIHPGRGADDAKGNADNIIC